MSEKHFTRYLVSIREFATETRPSRATMKSSPLVGLIPNNPLFPYEADLIMIAVKIHPGKS